MIAVAEIAERLNALAPELAPELLPNGKRDGRLWRFSGIADTGRSWSAWVNLGGAMIGQWHDNGAAAAGERHGDMLNLVALRKGLDMRAAVGWAKDRLGIADDFAPGAQTPPSRAEMAARAEAARARAEARQEQEARDKAAKARGAKALYLHELATKIAGTPAESYLRGRGLDHRGRAAWPNALRFHPEVWCRELGVKIPALLAPVYSAAGKQIGTHRTFLQHGADRRWRKLNSPNAKMMLGNMGGGFVPINKGASGKPMAKMPEGEPVYVTEGIEDAIVVRMMRPGARIVCAIALGNIGAIVLPEAARELVIVADRDDKPAAQDALERSIAQQQARGMAVRLVMPEPPHKDMNDWLQAWLAQGAARGVAA